MSTLNGGVRGLMTRQVPVYKSSRHGRLVWTLRPPPIHPSHEITTEHLRGVKCVNKAIGCLRLVKLPPDRARECSVAVGVVLRNIRSLLRRDEVRNEVHEQ